MVKIWQAMKRPRPRMVSQGEYDSLYAQYSALCKKHENLQEHAQFINHNWQAASSKESLSNARVVTLKTENAILQRRLEFMHDESDRLSRMIRDLEKALETRPDLAKLAEYEELKKRVDDLMEGRVTLKVARAAYLEGKRSRKSETPPDGKLREEERIKTWQSTTI